MSKPILCIDLDNVMANFDKATTEINPPEMYRDGFFRNLEVMPGAKEAVRRLFRSDKFDIHILSKPVYDSPVSYTEKVAWLAEHFPYLLNKITLTQDKGLFKMQYLIDDSIHWEPLISGEFIHFDPQRSCASWQNIVQYLLSQNNIN